MHRPNRRFRIACRARGAGPRLAALSIVAAAFTLAPPGPAVAGQIYGKITDNGRSVGGGHPIAVRNCRAPATTTDRLGFYEIFIADNGPCELVITYRQRQVAVTIRSYRDPVEYNFDLVRSGSGYAARRR